MSWISENRNMIRTLALVAFLLAMLGPWMYDPIYVPAEYACSAPIIRLEGDFCGLPMSGFRVLTWFVPGFIGMLSRLFNPTNPDAYSPRMVQYLTALFFIFPIFPFVGNLLMVFKHESQRLQTTNLIFWGIACVLTLPLLISGLGVQADKLWGLWIYIGLTICMSIIELLLLLQKSPHGIKRAALSS